MRCSNCCTELRGRDCPSCELYNAAVEAQQAAAHAIARNRAPKAARAWLNEYGVWAFVDSVATQLGTPEEAAPFAQLTANARKVAVFWKPEGR